jgi:hypothetical protein
MNTIVRAKLGLRFRSYRRNRSDVDALTWERNNYVVKLTTWSDGHEFSRFEENYYDLGGIFDEPH